MVGAGRRKLMLLAGQPAFAYRVAVLTEAENLRDTVQVPKQIAREPGVEDLASRRIRYERERRNWSTAELARRVTDAGCKLNQSSVWAIERAEPRRRISLDEAVALAQVFEMPLQELMEAPDEARASMRAFTDYLHGTNLLVRDVRQLAEKIRETRSDFPAVADAAALAMQYLEEETGVTFGTRDVEDAVAELAAELLALRDEMAARQPDADLARQPGE